MDIAHRCRCEVCEMGIAIRSATAADAQGILDCLGLAFAPYRNRYTPAGYADTAPRIVRFDAGGRAEPFLWFEGHRGAGA